MADGDAQLWDLVYLHKLFANGQRGVNNEARAIEAMIEVYLKIAQEKLKNG